MDSPQLEDLRDLAVPETPGIFPLAPGLVFLLVILGWLLLCAAWWIYQQRNATAYRRAGIALAKGAASVRELSVVLKRVAMVSYGREAVASLYGEEWVRYLENGCSGVNLKSIGDASQQPVSNELRGDALKWIKEHR
jgi:hypothetical protein